MYQGARVTVGAKAWLYLSIGLNALGLAAIAERIQPTRSILHLIVQVYENLVRGFLRVVGEIAGIAIPETQPLWLAAVATLLGGFYAVTNYYVLQTDGQSIFERIWEMGCYHHKAARRYLCAALKSTAFYVFGPLIYAYTAVSVATSGRPYKRLFGFAFEPWRILVYYTWLVSAVIVFYAASWE